MARIARNAALGWFVTALALAAPVRAAAATLHVGDLVVADYGATCGGSTEAADGIYQVDPATGIRTPISTGGFFSCPSGVTILPDWTILVADQSGGGDRGSVIRVDPTTGSQRVFTQPDNIIIRPVETIVEPSSGHIILVDFGPSTINGLLLRADRSTGAISRIFSALSTTLVDSPSGVAYSNVPGQIIVANGVSPGVGPANFLFLTRFDTSTATGSVLPTNSLQAPASGVARAADGFLYVLTSDGRVIKDDEATGPSGVVTSGGNLLHGDEIAFDPSAGDLVVADRFCCGRASVPDPSGPGPFVRVDPATGTQTVLNSAGFLNPVGLAVVTARTCGNGTLDPGEVCDDGNTIDGDGCEADCTLPACGNAVVDPGEECDDGNLVQGDACDTNCTVPRCGNAIYDPGEECDDGNADDFDDCHNDCRALVCSSFVPAGGPPKLTISHLGGLPNDSRISFKGSAGLVVIAGVGANPVNKGVRVVVMDQANTVLSDTTIPPGAYDPVTRTGWKVQFAHGNGFVYKPPASSTSPIQKVTVQYADGGPTKIRFSGTHVEYPVTAASLPLRAYVVLDPPLALSGKCTRAVFPANGPLPGCQLNAAGTTVACK